MALDAGASLLGFIMVPNRARTVDLEVAKLITALCKERQKLDSKELYSRLDRDDWTLSASKLIKENGPYAVGVFRNQTVEFINNAVESLGLDFVQLHGSEPRADFINQIQVPVIARFTPDDPELHTVNAASQALTLFDSEAGGEGKQLDWEQLDKWAQESGSLYVLAGGLTPENVSQAVKISGVVGVDVSGGVETDGVKDHQKIRDFIKAVQSSI